MLRVTIALFGTLLLLFAGPADAYVWKCHTPTGDVWTSQPAPSGDCEEYDDVYNPSAAPPATQSPPPQIAPQTFPPPPPYVGSYLPAPYIALATMDPGSISLHPRSGTGTEGTMGGAMGDFTGDAGASSGSTSSCRSVQLENPSKMRSAKSIPTNPVA